MPVAINIGIYIYMGPPELLTFKHFPGFQLLLSARQKLFNISLVLSTKLQKLLTTREK